MKLLFTTECFRVFIKDSRLVFNKNTESLNQYDDSTFVNIENDNLNIFVITLRMLNISNPPSKLLIEKTNLNISKMKITLVYNGDNLLYVSDDYATVTFPISSINSILSQLKKSEII